MNREPYRIAGEVPLFVTYDFQIGSITLWTLDNANQLRPLFSTSVIQSANLCDVLARVNQIMSTGVGEL